MSLTEAQAKALVAEAQAWFTALAITPAKQALWANALMGVRDLRVIDVRAALHAIACREKTVGEFWSLEIFEILAVSRAEMRRRLGREGQDLSRTAIPAKASDERRAKASPEEVKRWFDEIRGKLGGSTKEDNAGLVVETPRGPQQTIEEADARREELRRQADEIMRGGG